MCASGMTPFEGGITCNNADIYRYEIPRRPVHNLKPQVESLGLGSRFAEVKENYRRVNEMLGDIVKVTPFTPRWWETRHLHDSEPAYAGKYRGKGRGPGLPGQRGELLLRHDGPACRRFPQGSAACGAQGQKPITCRPGELLPPVDFEEKKREMAAFDANPSWRAVLSYCLYPKVVEDFVKNQKEYGYIMRLGSHVFFHGLAVGGTNKVNIADGKTPGHQVPGSWRGGQRRHAHRQL